MLFYERSTGNLLGGDRKREREREQGRETQLLKTVKYEPDKL